MSKVKDAVTLAMLLVAIVFSAGLLTLPEYSSAGLDLPGLSSAAPEGETYRPNVTSPPVPSVAPPAVTPEPLYTERDVEMLAKTIWAEARGVPSDAEKAAVAWCALNRLDAGTYGETLPEDYFFFEGDGLRNHFRKTYEKTGATWDWSLPDPYGEAAV